MASTPLKRRRFLALALAGAGSGLVLPQVLSGVTGGAARAAVDPRVAVVAMVEDACAALERHGFPRGIGRSAPGTWSRLDSGLYVFLLDRSGRLLLHPEGQMEGADVSGARDLAGDLFIQEILDATEAHPEGVWTEYLWAEGPKAEPGTKHTYSKPAATPDSGTLIACAGYIATEI